MSDQVNQLREDLRRDFEKGRPLRSSLLDREPISSGGSHPVTTTTAPSPATHAVAVLVRTDEALTRLERAAEFLERLADTLEQQADQVRGRL